MFDTGISIAVPSIKLYARIALRSGLAVKGLHIGASVVDSDDRRPIKVLLINNSDTSFRINTGDCMAQLILECIENLECVPVKELPSTGRGSNGFGFTGINYADLGCNGPMIVPVRLNKDTTGSAMIDRGTLTEFRDLDLLSKITCLSA